MAPNPLPKNWEAGVSKIEITPPPGYPLGGHGPAANVAVGYWTRLYSRAFYFLPPDGEPFVMVSTDLWAVPAGLTAKVLEIVNKETYLPPERLVLAATHTHHSPGNFMTSFLYTDFTSFVSGHDERLFGYLANRIAKSIIWAFRMRKSATIALYEGSECTLQINRALEAFASNNPATIEAVVKNRKYFCDDAGRELPRSTAADPRLRVLEIRSERDVPFGLLVFYAVHPTVTPGRTPLYGSDFVGVAMENLERHFGAVAGFFNGAEGDVAVPRLNRDLDASLVYGHKLSRATRKVLCSKPIPVHGDSILSEYAVINKNYEGFSTVPMAGVATFGGAELDRSQHYSAGWRGGIVAAKKDLPDQGYKQRPLDKRIPGRQLGGHLIFPLSMFIPLFGYFPREFPLAMHSFGNTLTIAVTPFEMTTAMGREIMDDISQVEADRQRNLKDRVQVIGLANEYYSYMTTEGEFAIQRYEGASTMLGEKQGTTVRGLLKGMTPSKPESKRGQRIDSRTYIAGGKNKFGIPFLDKLPPGGRQLAEIPDVEIEEIVPARFRFKEVELPRFRWTERCPEHGCEEWDWESTRRVKIIRAGLKVEKVVADETGARIVTVLDRSCGASEEPSDSTREKPCSHAKSRTWTAFWFFNSTLDDSADEFFFRVQTQYGHTVEPAKCSAAFSLAKLPRKKGSLPASIPEMDCPSLQ